MAGRAGGAPLVGRDAELARIGAVLDQRRSVVVAGRTGVGKSALGRAALDRCRRSGRTVVRVTATRSSGGIPLGAFAAWLPTGPTTRDGPDGRAALLRHCAEELVRRSPAGPLVLGVDDAHLLDDMSATLVHLLAADRGVLVVATVRSGERAPDPVVALWKDGHADRVELGGLGAPQVAEVLASTLGGPPDDACVAEVMARSGGNMLFLTELVAGARSDGVLRDDDGVWRLVGELRPSDRLVELVEDRLAGLDDAERALLEVLALGEPLGIEELARLGDASVAERLERKALLTTSSHRSRLLVRLGHPVYGEVLRLRMPTLRARAVSRALAESVEATGEPRPEDLLRIATWRLTGGGADAGVMLAAAVEARWRFDFRLAEQLARAAVDRGAGTRAALLAAQLASLQGRTAQADRELAEIARQASTPVARGQVALVRLDNRVIYAGAVDDGLRLARAAEDELADAPGDAELRDEIASRRAALLLATGGPRRALEAVTPLLARASGRALAWACMPGAYSLARTGRITEAMEVARRGAATQAALETPVDWYPFMHRFYEAEALHHAGRLAEAERIVLECYREGVANRSLEQQAVFSWQLAKPVTDRGHVLDAARHARRAIGIYRQLDRGQFVEFCSLYLAQALALAGRHAEACAALRDLEMLGVGSTYFMGVDLLTTRGWVDVAGGHLRRGRDGFLESAAEGVRIGDLVGALAALHAAARIGFAETVGDRADAVAADVEGELGAARAAHVRGLVEHDPRVLEDASASFEAMGADLLAAEAAAHAAVHRSRAGDRRARVAAERRAARLAARCEGAATPALSAVAVQAELTPAEREAARLAAAGMSNREIAAELVVSVRTVENRLQIVYGKLGVRSRRELPAAVTGTGEPAS